MRNHDYELIKAMLDELHASGSTTLAPCNWRQPSSVYCDPARLHLEHEVLFDRLPLVAAFSSELIEPTSFVSRYVVGTPILIARQPDGSLRAFLNSCRHRATEVVWGETTACTRRFTCPYHGWSYGTDGRLLGITTTVGFPDVDRGTHGLIELSCEERHGLVWVARRPGVGIDLDTFLGGFDAEFAAMELARYVVERTVDLSVDANWKLIMDGFTENYHVRFLHSQTLTPYLHSDRVAFLPFGQHGRHLHPRLTYDPSSQSGPEDFLAQVLISYNLFPNVDVLWAGDHFEVYQIEPDLERPDRSRVRMSLLVRPDTRDRTAQWDKNLQISSNIIVSEDFAAAVAAQRALNGGAAPPDVVYGCNEPALQHYHQQLSAALLQPVA